jgi:hypothetical protein
MKKEIYEVWRNTPIGDLTMGLYTTIEEANKHKESWNKKIKTSMDKAFISRKVILEKYEEDSNGI